MANPVRRRARIGLALALLVGGSWPAQTQISISGQAFNLEFRAFDRSGQPVLDLTAADVRVRVDGREWPVRSLLLRRSGGSLPPPFASNSETGRDVVLVIDEDSILPGSIEPVREALKTVVDMLGSNDRVGLLSLNANGMSVPPLDRRASVDRAIADIRGRAFSRETADDFACRTRVALQRLGKFIGALPRSATTTLLVFSAALAVPAPAPVFTVGGQTCILQPSHFDEFRDIAQQSAVSIYGLRVVDPALPDNAERAVGLEKLVASLNGRFERLSTTPHDQLQQVVEETAAWYVISVELEGGAPKISKRAIDLQILREGVHAGVPREAFFTTTDLARASPRDMLRVSTPFRALPLRAAAYPSANPGDPTMKIVVLFEPEGQAALRSAMAALFTDQGRLVTQWVSEPTDLEKRPVVAALIAPAGTYRLRVAATDASDRSGAVDTHVHAELTTAGALKLSAALLGAPDGGSIAPRLRFGRADRAAVVYLEAYGARRCAGVASTLELSDSENGPARMTAAASLTPIDQSDVCILSGGFDIGDLPPGDYVVRAIVTLNDKPAGRVMRTLRRTIQ